MVLFTGSYTSFKMTTNAHQRHDAATSYTSYCSRRTQPEDFVLSKTKKSFSRIPTPKAHEQKTMLPFTGGQQAVKKQHDLSRNLNQHWTLGTSCILGEMTNQNTISTRKATSLLLSEMCVVLFKLWGTMETPSMSSVLISLVFITRMLQFIWSKKDSSYSRANWQISESQSPKKGLLIAQHPYPIALWETNYLSCLVH